MASRPATSRQPLSRASADLRASPESFSAIAALLRASSGTSADDARHSQIADQFLPNGKKGAMREKSPRWSPGGRQEVAMGWSLTIGSVAGTAIRIHVTFLLFLAWIFGVSYVSGGPQAAWNGLLFMVLLFLCVLLHEFGHIFTARAFGVTTPDVILLPIGGVARLERIPEKPSEEFLIAIAGPAVNVVIAAVLVLFAGAHLDPRHLEAIGIDKAALAERLTVVNVFLALFNLIPAFPMDGGRVLRALLATRFGYVRATEIAASVGQAVAFVLGFIGLFGDPLLIFIAVFVYLAAAA